MRFFKTHWIDIVVYSGALAALAIVAWQYFQGQLSANPIRGVELTTGRFTLSALVLTLACTPVFNLSRLKQILSLRRPLGFTTASFAILHFLTFIGLDYRFDFSLIWEDSSGKRYIWVGFATLIILLGLAFTSTSIWRKKLGDNWKRFQQLIYPAAILGALHFIWSAKADLRLPLIYTGVIIFLLILRLPIVSGKFRIRREKRKAVSNEL